MLTRPMNLLKRKALVSVAVIAIGTVFITMTAQATSLLLTLSGSNGSNVINYTASGSVTLTRALAEEVAHPSGLGPRAASEGTAAWTSSFDNDLGDFLNDAMVTSLNDNLVLSDGGVSYRRNGVEFGVLDTIDLDGGVGGGLDDIELDPTGNITYPASTSGDVISWTGSGTFTLEDGETFDTLFTATGSFSNAIDGGNYTVTIAAVPEPTTYALLTTLSLGGFALWRRRSSGQGLQD